MGTPQDPPYPFPPPPFPTEPEPEPNGDDDPSPEPLPSRGMKEMKRIVIKVPAVNADILEIGDDCANFGHVDYVIEKIGDPYTNDKGWRMVEITLMERTKP
jgi:hypothetical protein